MSPPKLGGYTLRKRIHDIDAENLVHRSQVYSGDEVEH